MDKTSYRTMKREHNNKLNGDLPTDTVALAWSKKATPLEVIRVIASAVLRDERFDIEYNEKGILTIKPKK